MPSRKRSDEELLAAFARERDADAMEELLARHASLAWGLALGVTRREELAKDAVQEAWLRALRGAASWRPGLGSARAWLASVVARTAMELMRGEKRRARREEAVAMNPREPGWEAPDEAAVRKESAAAVRGALGALPDEERLAVMLASVHGFRQREIAGILSIPQTTVSKRMRNGLRSLRRALEAGGFGALAIGPALAGFGNLAPPAHLTSSLAATVTTGAATAGKTTAAAATTAAVKGGIAMKAVVSVIVASTVAGAVAVSTGLFGAANIEPAPANPVAGRETREEVFEFTQKPKVAKQGEKYVITFASKGRCDATVSAVAPDGRVVAHVASGVLGKNAPYPFQQNSLSQKIEWDGKTDTGKPVPAGTKIKVSLGLKASFERVVAWDPQAWIGKREKAQHVVFGDGTTCVVGNDQVRLYGKDGKYLKTLAPHAADTPREKLTAFTFIKTIYGDESVPVTIGRGWRHNFHSFGTRGHSWSADPAKKCVIWTTPSYSKRGTTDHFAIGVDGSFTKTAGPGPAKLTEGPGKIAAASSAPEATYASQPRITADPFRDEAYVTWKGGHVCSSGTARYDGKTGKRDETWPEIGSEQMDVGPDGLVYARVGSYGRLVVRFTRDGKVVDFPKGEAPKKGYYDLPTYLNKYPQPIKAIATYGTKGSNVQQKGFAVSPGTGDIYVHIQYVEPTWAAKHCKEWKEKQQLLAIFNPDGEVKNANAMPGMPCNHGLGVDRWGNVYKGVKDTLPEGQPLYDGLAEMPKGRPGWGQMVPAGSIVKFPGGPFPVGSFKSIKEDGAGVKLPTFRAGGGRIAEKAVWAFGGISPLGGSACTCCHSMFDVDPFGRSWLPQAHVSSVMVLDTNGNKVLRIGKYGNADSQGPESLVPEPEIGFTWVRAVSATDRALWAYDPGNRRVLKVNLSYEAEETLGLDGTASAQAPKPTASAPDPTAPKTESPAPAPAPVAPRSAPSPESVCRGWYSLAMSYKRAGRRDKAREYLQRIVDEHPKTELAATARKELARL